MTEQDYELLSAYLDEMLTSSEREALEARLSIEPDLRRELNALRQTVALMRQLPVMKAPRNYTLTPAMVADIRREAQSSIAKKPTSGRIITFPSLPLISALSTAAAVVLISLGLILMSTNGSQDAADSSAASESIVAAAPTTSAMMTATVETSFANTGELSTAERLTASARTANDLSDTAEMADSDAEEADLAEEPNANAFDTEASGGMAAQATAMPTQPGTFAPPIAGAIQGTALLGFSGTADESNTQDESGTNTGGLGGEGADDRFAPEEEMAEAVVAPMTSDQTILPSSSLTNESQLYFDTVPAQEEDAQMLNQQVQPSATNNAVYRTATQLAQEAIKAQTQTSLDSTEVAVNRELFNAPEDDSVADNDGQEVGVFEQRSDTNESEQESQQTAAIVLIIAGVLAAGVAILTYLQTRRGSA